MPTQVFSSGVIVDSDRVALQWGGGMNDIVLVRSRVVTVSGVKYHFLR